MTPRGEKGKKKRSGPEGKDSAPPSQVKEKGAKQGALLERECGDHKNEKLKTRGKKKKTGRLCIEKILSWDSVPVDDAMRASGGGSRISSDNLGKKS